MNSPLNRDLLPQLPTSNLQVGSYTERPIKVLQFGTGNFLRGFIDWAIDQLNSKGLFDGNIQIVQSSESSSAAKLNQQDGLYTLIERGLDHDKAYLITSLKETFIASQQWSNIIETAQSKDLSLVISNTTEAGIAYQKEDRQPGKAPQSYPAKLTELLYQRYTTLGQNSGLCILPMELIENNGEALKNIVHQHAKDWQLEDGFTHYVEHDCEFSSSLVDRIVSGYPHAIASNLEKEFGFTDQNMVMAEPYFFLGIQNGNRLRELLPLEKLDLQVLFVDDLKPYRDTKVSFLNGAHTSTVLAAYHCHCDTVLELMQHPKLHTLLQHSLSHEISPCVPLTQSEKETYVQSVLQRFANPSLKHRLLDISLNSLSKWKARVLPTLKTYVTEKKQLPLALTFSLAALIYFYRNTNSTKEGQRSTETYPLRDDADKLEVLREAWTQTPKHCAETVLTSKALWDEDLSTIQGLKDQTQSFLESMLEHGTEKTLTDLLEQL